MHLTGDQPVLTGGVSVIIPTRNRATTLRTVLLSLLSQTHPPDEILIIDDSTDAATEKLIGALQLTTAIPLRYFHPATGSLTRARNFGVARCRGEVTVFLDDDAVVRADHVAILTATLAQSGPAYAGGSVRFTLDPGFAPIMPRCRDWLSRIFWLGGYGDGIFCRNGMITIPAEQEQVCDTELLPGGSCIVRTTIAREYGYDAAMNGYALFEDVDFSYRVSRRYRFFYNPHGMVFHDEQEDDRYQTMLMARLYLRNYLYYFRKNFGLRNTALPVLAWTILGLSLKAIRNRSLKTLRGYAVAVWETARDGARPV